MKLQFDRDDLRPIVEAVVMETLQAMGDQQPNSRLGYTESEAAEAIGVKNHVLRDARLRGEIKARKVGKRYVYAADELRRFLNCY
jgi:hypothetical protein